MKDTVIYIVFTIPILTALGAGATTIRVDWSGEGDYPTIQEGIDAAAGGDTVLVLPGTYAGANNRNLDFGGRNLVLMSEGGLATTIIDCGDAGRGFVFSGGEDTTSVVRGFTITNAAADSGAGAFCENGSTPRFEECHFLGNAAQNMGGGLCCTGSSPIVRYCVFEDNTANQESPADGYGGGMACLDGSSPPVTDTDFVSNWCRYSGGGLYSYYSPASCIRCVFIGNNLLNYGSEGAGVAVAFSDGCAFTYCTFTENGTTSSPVGGGLHVGSSDITLTDCSFLGNVSGSSGGAHFTFGSSGTVSGCTFAGNLGVWSACGGISCVLSSNLTITNCTFADNEYYHIWCDEASPTIEYSILAFALLGGAANCDQGTETPYIHHCVVYGNASADTLCGGNHHDILNSNPLFCDRPNDNFTLCENSPCLPGATWPSLVGAHGQGCGTCENAVEPTTWGTIKAMFR